MRDLKNKLTSGKNTKNIKPRRGKNFGYHVLGFASALRPILPYDISFLVLGGGGGGAAGGDDQQIVMLFQLVEVLVVLGLQVNPMLL